MNTGYSGKPLIEKLGYAPGDTIWLLNAPPLFTQYIDNRNITPCVKPPADWGHAFFTTEAELAEFCVRAALTQVGKGWWVSWPKKSSGVSTDLTEQSFRDYLLPLGWVDTKVCAIDDIWSGLKFLRKKS